MGDTKPKDKLVGLPVESASGEQLSSVVDIVRNKAGTPTYAVVPIDTDTTAVPLRNRMWAWSADGKVVMSPDETRRQPRR